MNHNTLEMRASGVPPTVKVEIEGAKKSDGTGVDFKKVMEEKAR